MKAAAVEPVFVDDSGRRAWICRSVAMVVLLALSVAAVGYFAALGRPDSVRSVALSANPIVTDSDPFPIAVAADPPAAPCDVITGLAYIDADLNGSPQPIEKPVPGLAVTAYGVNDVVVARAVTGADGRFELRPSAVGPTRVELTTPEDTLMEAPVGYGSSPPVSFPSKPHCDLVIGLAWLGMFATSPQTTVSTIGDRVWLDVNGDGREQADEPGLAGVGVRLYDAAGTLVAETVTAIDGTYTFGGIEPGNTYRVALDRPSDRNAGGPLAGRTVTAAPRAVDGVTVTTDANTASMTVVVNERGASSHGVDFAVKPQTLA